MPSNTTYYNLFIFDPSGSDTGSTFLSFRTDIAGPAGSSNFIIIDTALHTHDTQIAALQNIHGIINIPLLYQSANFFTASGITAIASYTDGLIIDASLNQDCTGAVTININSIGTKSLQKYNSTGSALIDLSAGDMKENKEYLFRYSFSAGVFIWINPTAGDQTNIVGTSGNFIKINTNNTLVDLGISQSNFSATGTFALSGDNLASPNTTTGSQNDVVITGLSVFGWNGGSASTINGFAGGAEGRILIIENQTTAYQLTISNENTGSSAVNRIRTPDQGSYIIGPRQSIQLIYDSIDNRWIIQEVGTYRSNPTMNGTASPGTAGQLQSSGDHVHPSDTTRAIGPGSSTANNLVKFSSTDGETLADAGTPLSVLNGAVTPGTTGNVLTSNGSAWTSAAPGASGLPKGYLFGLTLSNDGTAPTHVLDIAAGKCRDSTDTGDMVLTAITKDLNVSWAVGNGNGGLDTGSVGNNTYHVFVIKRTDTNVVDVLFSLSATAPTMPASYTLFRRVGSIVRIAAAIKTFIQDADEFIWMVPVQDIYATNPGTSAVTRTMTLPTGIRVLAHLGVRTYAATSGDALTDVFISDLSITDTAASSSAFSIGTYIVSYSYGQVAGGPVSVFTNTSAQVRSRCEGSGTTGILMMISLGWADSRGMLA